jgi:hypothetical protein
MPPRVRTQAEAQQRSAIFALLIAAQGCSEAREPDARARDAREMDAADAASPPHCGIAVQAWALETDSLVVPLACKSGAELPRDQIEVEALPDGAELDLDAAELRWTPGLDQAGNHRFRVRLPGRERGEIRIGVADRFEDPDNVPIADPHEYTHEFGVPVFHLGVGPDLNGDAHTPATLIYEGRDINGAAAKYRGSTSSNYPKRSFTFKFDKDAPFIDEARGFPNARRIVLTTNFDDNSNLRQRLSFTLWNKLAPEHVQIQSFNAVLYLDGQYLGLYQVTDHVDDDLLRAQGFPDDVNVYKARTHAANFRMIDDKGRQKRALWAGYSKDEGFPEEGQPDAYADLESLVDWIANAQPDDFFADYETRLDRRDFGDWLVFTHLIAAGDTTNKNCYLIHDARPDAPDPRWRFVPWDFNTSFGQGFATQRLPAENFELDRQSRRNAFFQRQLTDPRLREPMLERYREILKGPWALEDILAALDAWSHEIEGAALRDEVKWREAYPPYWELQRKDYNRNTYPEEIAYIREWLKTRWSFIASNL